VASNTHLSKEDAQERYDYETKNIADASGRISELCKYVWAGSLAIFYALISAEQTSAAHRLIGSERSLLFIAAISGALAFVFDYLQNFCTYLHSLFLANWMESQDPIATDEYDRRIKSKFSIASEICFYIKNVAVMLTAGLVAYVIVAGSLK
jgi:hypothetical protein